MNKVSPKYSALARLITAAEKKKPAAKKTPKEGAQKRAQIDRLRKRLKQLQEQIKNASKDGKEGLRKTRENIRKQLDSLTGSKKKKD